MGDGERLAFEQMLVHNLKAPLSGIIASLEMLHDGDLGSLTEQQRSAVSLMQAQGAELVRMIDELLELGRTQSSSFPVQKVPVDPREFLEQMRSEWRDRLARLTSVVSPDVPDALADPTILRRVFDNLLMNSSVHAGSNASVILQAERSGDFVRFSVADDGPGVPASEGERIFDPFVTLDRTGARRTHGLGLAYCRAALAAMGGTISLAPSTSGAMFVVQVPAALVLTRQALEQDQ
jgi:two-component system sensor histidine kinase GlrK